MKAKKIYTKEARDRWKNTSAFKESRKKTAEYTKDDWAEITRITQAIYDGFVNNMGKDASASEVQELVADWQKNITKYYYKCNNEILCGLGKMYVADKRFMENIDKRHKGLAVFMSKAIEYYCKNKERSR